jgi:hypothetical protein
MVLVRHTAAVALLTLLAAPSAADDFTDELLGFTGCAQVEGGRLVLTTCYDPAETCSESLARMISTVPGTLTFDLTWDVTGVKEYSQFIVSSEQVGWQFVHQGPIFVDAWCEPQPCGGEVLDVSIDVTAGDVIDFYLTNNGEPCLPGDDGLRCILDNLRFVPEPGLHELGFGLDGAPHYDRPLPSEGISWFYGEAAAVDDQDGDGVRDVALGLPVQSYEAENLGRVLVISGRTGKTIREFVGEDDGNLGMSVADAGDVDGDGVGDLAAGEPNPPAPNLARVHVWSGATGEAITVLTGPKSWGWGDEIAGVGDLDGDGVGDILLGMADQSQQGFGAGAVQVISGADNTLIFEAFGDADSDQMGYDVAALGDVDGDGVGDFAGSAVGNDIGGTSAGVVRVWSGADFSLLHEFVGDSWGDRMGEKLAEVGDFNADGYADVLIGSPSADLPAGTYNEGRVEVRSGLDGSLLMARYGSVGSRLGDHIAGVGDVDGDGTDDVAVTDESEDRILLFGGPDGQPLGELASLNHDDFGQGLAGLDDLDGDGGADVLVIGMGQFGRPTAVGMSTRPDVQEPPTLTGLGFPLPLAPIGVFVDGGAPNALAVLVLGFETLDAAPFKSGVLVPAPDLVIPGVPLDGTGALELTFNWPVELPPPASAVLQVWIPDEAAASGWTATNGLAMNAQ